MLVVPPLELAELGSLQGSNGTRVDATNRLRWNPVYPNPARSGSGVWLQLPTPTQDAVLDVGIYDVRGRRVRQFRSIPGSDARGATVHWDGRTANGRIARAGVYFMQVRSGQDTHRRRVLLID